MIPTTAIATLPKKPIILRAIGDTHMMQAKINKVIELRDQFMVKGIHYGPPFPGSERDALHKPGADILCSYFGLCPNPIERTCIQDWEKPFFFYRYECQLLEIGMSTLIGTGIGSCNSMESKYRFREGKRKCPECDAEQIMVSKYPDQHTGRKGFYCRSCKVNFTPDDVRIIGQLIGRVENDDPYSLVNTIDKQAFKRAYMAAILTSTGASAVFAQSEKIKLSRFPTDPDAIEADWTEIEDEPEPAPQSTNGHSTPPEPKPEAPVVVEPPKSSSQPAMATPRDQAMKWLMSNSLNLTEAEKRSGKKAPTDANDVSAWKDWTKAVKDAPTPAAESPKFDWTAESLKAMDDYVQTYYDLSSSKALSLLGLDAGRWQVYPSDAVAEAMVDNMVREQELPMIVDRVKCIASGVDRYKLVYLCKASMPEERNGEHLIALGDKWKEVVEGWKPGQDYKLPNPVKIFWKLDNGRPTVMKVEDHLF